ncbi:hypothetical protein PWT90_02531 [Aphanocladium album]|nr:hypothetical protein PWT90_02531 [Aphanocladium album]
MRIFNSLLFLLPLAAASPVAEISAAPLTLDSALSSRNLEKRCSDECYDIRTSWQYWWWGVGNTVNCGAGEDCSIAKGESQTLGWSTTVGFNIGFPAAKGISSGLSASYTFSESYTTSLTYTLHWAGPGARRLWVKQWYAVTDATCKKCSNFCSPEGCWPRYRKPEPVRFWVPCTQGDCSEFMIDDPHARCDYGNNCSPNA